MFYGWLQNKKSTLYDRVLPNVLPHDFPLVEMARSRKRSHHGAFHARLNSEISKKSLGSIREGMYRFGNLYMANILIWGQSKRMKIEELSNEVFSPPFNWRYFGYFFIGNFLLKPIYIQIVAYRFPKQCYDTFRYKSTGGCCCMLRWVLNKKDEMHFQNHQPGRSFFYYRVL